MAHSQRSSGIRSRALGAALVTLGTSLGVPLTPQMLAAPAATEKPLAHEGIKLQANQHKDRAALQKSIEADKAALQADQIKLAELQKLPVDQFKLEANQQKFRALKSSIESAQKRLEANQIKFDRAAAK